MSIIFDVVQKNKSPQAVRFTNKGGTICLFDTGANFPVWCTGLGTLMEQYPDAHRVNNVRALIKGFGGPGTIADVYQIPKFVISDGKDALTIMGMWVAICDNDFGCDIVLSYPLFYLANVSITTFTRRGGLHKINPLLHIDAMKKLFYAKNDVIQSKGKTYFRKTYCLAAK